MMKILTYIFFFALFILIMVFFARWFEKSSIYFPYRGIETTPEYVGLTYEDVYYETKDGVKINAWFIPASGTPRATVLFCHGNAGNISHRLEIIKMLHSLGLNVFIFDYRGYGKSKGSPSEEGTYLDALAAYEYLVNREDVDEKNIIIHGKSLGAAITIELATKVNPKIVISESAFTSIGAIGREIYPFLPMEIITSIKYDNKTKIGKLDIPVLVIHSREDEIIPYHHGEELYEAATEPKEFYSMKGGHNEGILVYRDEYLKRIDDFLRKNGI
ncbi:alpha/beta hydrolase [Candidatus Omnitrophota bacterium]